MIKMIKKMILGIIMLLLIVIVLLFFILQLNTPDYYHGALSNHFDGKKFFNPVPYQPKTLSDMLRWSITRHRAVWPKHVANLPAQPVKPVEKSQLVRITFINHSTVLIQTKKINILTDPIWSYRASPLSFIGPARVRDPGISFNELPRIDVVLISHNHYDHLDIPTLVQLKNKFNPLMIVPLGNKSFLARKNLTNVMEMDWGMKQEIAGAIITFLPAKHWSARWITDKFRTLWGSFGIEVENKKIYFAADTGFSLENLNHIKNTWGSPDIAFLPIGAYKPEWFMHDNHMNPAEAVQTFLALHAKVAIPMHYRTFQLSDEGIDEPLQNLNKALVLAKIPLQNFSPLNEGQSRDFN